MKPLDKNKKYDLSQLNDDQLQAVYKETFTPRHIKCDYLYFDEDKWWFTTDRKGCLTNALELFEEELKNYQITEYATGDFGDLGIKKGVIKAKDKDHAWLLHKESKGLKDSEKGLFSFVEVPENINFKKELPNITFTQNESIYDDMLSLIEKGKKHGLKIVVTFEKL